MSKNTEVNMVVPNCPTSKTLQADFALLLHYDFDVLLLCRYGVHFEEQTPVYLLRKDTSLISRDW